MLEKYLNNHFLILYLSPLILGLLTVFSFEPFNITLINFIILPIFFYLLVYIKKKSKSIYRKKPFKKNLFIFGTAFGFGFYLSGIHWITNSLTFDTSFKILIPFALILLPLFLSLFISIVTLLIGPFLNCKISLFSYLEACLFQITFVQKYLQVFLGICGHIVFSSSIEIIQILNKIGLFAFNLISITIFMLPAILLVKTETFKKLISMTFMIIIIFFFYIYGNYSINQNQLFLNSVKDNFYIKVISPNFKLEYGLSNKEIESRLLKLVKISDPDNLIKTIFLFGLREFLADIVIMKFCNLKNC